MRMPGEHERMSASDARKRNANLMETSLRGRDRLARGFRETTDLAPAFLRTRQVSVERIAEARSAGPDLGIHGAFDQPCRRGAIDVDPLASNPFHADPSGS